MNTKTTFQLKLERKEKEMIAFYHDRYTGIDGARQMDVFAEIANIFGYASADSVNTKFQNMRKKYGKNFNKVKA